MSTCESLPGKPVTSCHLLDYRVCHSTKCCSERGWGGIIPAKCRIQWWCRTNCNFCDSLTANWKSNVKTGTLVRRNTKVIPTSILQCELEVKDVCGWCPWELEHKTSNSLKLGWDVACTELPNQVAFIRLCALIDFDRCSAIRELKSTKSYLQIS